MLKNYIFGLILIISTPLWAQKSFTLNGKIHQPNDQNERIFILNKTTDEIVKTNVDGSFEIVVNRGDQMVVFDENDYYLPKVFYIVDTDRQQTKHIRLTAKPEELEELVIDAKPTAESLGLPEAAYKKPNPEQADLKKIFLAVIGLFANKNKAPEPPNFYERKAWLESQISMEELTKKYEIPAEKIDIFYRYLADDISFFNTLQTNLKAKEIELYEKSYRFLNPENTTNEK